MYKKILLLTLFIFPQIVFPQVSGKIRGKITDAATKEAIIGANVVVVGTSLGAVTNVEGDYIIMNVAAGNYSLKSSYIGYTSVIHSNVQVIAGKTTDRDFKLQAEGVEVKEVITLGERPLIQKDQATTSRYTSREDLKNLPVRDVKSAVALVPGVVAQNDRGTKKLYIRGGRADEVGYYVEGASVRNVVDGQELSTVIPEALEEFQVQSGGYTAEFGGANAGIIRQTLRSGTSNFSGSITAETDNFTPQYEKSNIFDTYSYGYSNYVLTLSGPITDKLKFFVAGENQFQKDNSVKFWDGFRITDIQDDGLLNGDGSLFTVETKPGNIPGTSQSRYTGNGTITYDAYPVQVRLGGTFSWQQNQNSGTNPIRRTLITNQTNGETWQNTRWAMEDKSSALTTLRISHFLDNETFYELNLNYFDYRRKTYDPVFGDEFWLYNDSLANEQAGIDYGLNYTYGTPRYQAFGFIFDYPGRLISGYSKQKQSYIGGSLDFTKQIGNEHEVKFGGTFQEYTVRSFSSVGTKGILDFFRSFPDIARTPGIDRDFQMRTQGGNINAYGYDIYGNEINKGVDAPKHPVFGGVYLLDKIEFSDLIVNLGVRLDYIDMNDRKLKDPTDPQLDPETFELLEIGLEDMEPFMQISPRLGFAFPVTERTVFHMQYGKFVQAPQLNTIYAGQGLSSLIFKGGNFVANPLGYGLEPERTTQYEIGFTQQISDYAKFDLTGFYKDIKGQIQVDKISTISGSRAASYSYYVNGDFATTKGLEFNFTLQRVNRIQAVFNYTLSDALGTGSVGNSAISSVESGDVRPTVISPLTFNQTHRGTFNIDYRFGKDDGGPFLEQFGANFLFTFTSGHPFTLSGGSIGQRGPEEGGFLGDDDPRQRSPLEQIGASTTPWNFNFDVRFDKTVDFAGIGMNFYVYVQNLFNTKHIIDVYSRTGSAYDDGYLTNPDLSGLTVQGLGDKYVELYEAINLEHRINYNVNQGGDLFGAPRQIRFGVKMEL